jgi:hypothetical protein
VLEHWSGGVMGYPKPNTAVLHYSNTAAQGH